jgi:hypothetical protein
MTSSTGRAIGVWGTGARIGLASLARHEVSGQIKFQRHAAASP